MTDLRIGFGTDIHRLVSGRPLIIGGVQIDSDLGAEGHSDADVLMHAVTDALLGALALGDIGMHFPNTAERWKNAASSEFVLHAFGLITEKGFRVTNIDANINLEAPKLRPYIEHMRHNISKIVQIEIDRVSVKAKSGEEVDAVGEGRAISANATVLLAAA